MSLKPKYPEYYLYIEFHRSLNENVEQLQAQIKEICPLVTHIRRPRQGKAKFCFVHFDSEENQLKAKTIFEDFKVKGRKIIVQLPLDKDSPLLTKKKIELEKRRKAAKVAKRLKSKAKRAATNKMTKNKEIQ